MKSSTSFSPSALVVALLVLILSAGCARTTVAVPERRITGGGTYRVALFPVENLSGARAPLKEVRQLFADKLRGAGVDVLPDDVLAQFMARHRIRYIGGIDDATAREIKEEAAVDAVLITSLEFFSAAYPPKVAIAARLVSATSPPEILWMEGVGMAGDDAPGAFEMGVVRDAPLLVDKALSRLSGLLREYLSNRSGSISAASLGRTLRPKIFYRSDIDPSKNYRVAVIPFINRSDRKNGADILGLHFVRELRKIGNFHIIEPGVVRHELLQYRVIMEEGMSLANADVMLDTLHADLLLTGKVIDYQDYQGAYGTPKVHFSTMIVDKENRMVVEASEGHNTGDDHVLFFDFGRLNTAHTVATEMVRGIVEMIGVQGGLLRGDGKK